MYEIISPLLVFVGLIFLLISIFDVRKIITTTSSLRTWWNIVQQLIIFFIVGYALILLFVLLDRDSRITFLMSIILCGGGFFVYFMMKLSRNTLGQFHKMTKLEDENIKIKIVQQRLQHILDHAAESIVTFAASGIIDACNKATGKLFGYKESELIGQNIWVLIAGYRENILPLLGKMVGKEVELKGVTKGGKEFPVSVRVNDLFLSGQRFYTGIISDIRKHKSMLAKMQELVDHDELTGLYSKRYFMSRLQDTLELLKRNSFPCMLLYLDVDFFKGVNDTLGHEGGDKLLQQIGEVLKVKRRKSDCVARLAGDEFALFLYNIESENGVNVAEKIRQAVATEEFVQDGKTFKVSCSIGCYAVTDPTMSAEEVLAKADAACYKAKHQGRDSVSPLC